MFRFAIQGSAPGALRRLVLPAALSCLLASVAPARAQRSPTCEAFYAAAPRIESITILREPVFPPEEPVPGWFPAAALNRIHPLSREWLVSRELLFREGERLDRERLNETLRNLRALGLFQREEIRCEEAGPDAVHVRVRTRDAWTLEPILDLAVLDEGTAWTVGLRESNLLGRGKTLEATYADRFGDRRIAGRFVEPRILDSRWAASLNGADFESGESLGLRLNRPFFSLETPWSASLDARHARGDESRVDDGVTVNEYRARRRRAGAAYEIAVVPGAPVTHRAGLYYRWEEKRFSETPESLAPPPTDRRFSSLGLRYRRLVTDYITERRVNRFDRPEYFNLGNDLRLELGVSLSALGADRDEALFFAADRAGVALREGHFLTGSLLCSGRYHGGRVENLELAFRGDWVLRDTVLDGYGLAHSLVGRLRALYTERLDDDRFVSLGESNGLRGYASHAVTGRQRLLLSLEDRVFAERRVAGVLALGGIVFADAGYVWKGLEDVRPGDLAVGLGLGLRVAWPAASNEQILRLDLAFPLRDLPGDDGRPKFSFLTSRRF